VIISASRRTDIPAFYGRWFANRIKAGFAEAANPFNFRQVRNIDLRPEAVDTIVFWTRNARPFLKYLPRLDREGYRYYFLYTITGYPKELEPNLPSVKSAVETFRKLSGIIGPERVIWRYDPIAFCSMTGPDFHKRNFEDLAKVLSGSTKRVIISFMDFYRKTARRLADLKCRHGIQWRTPDECVEKALAFSTMLRQIASVSGMAIQSCAEEFALAEAGIPPGQCVDYDLVNHLYGPALTYRKDATQRKQCLCGTSIDIGAYNTCGYRCVYCYANTSFNAATRNLKAHKPDNPSLSPPLRS
jgi:hypothetical protein